ncbi:MAG TPA: carboxypeptidase regulatory-like domain-containing protein [Terriglobia bacterium]|nr:carboxypeptidase regulatory-like domain-containing protein [Terriglobia bacterium]
MRRTGLPIIVFVVLCCSAAAAEHRGFVKFGGLPVPGVAVTAMKGQQKLVAITDPQGVYAFPELPDGVWTIRVEMLGFAPIQQDITVAAGAAIAEWDLKMLPLEEIHAEVLRSPTPAPAPAKSAGAQPAAPAPSRAGFQRAEVNASSNSAAPAAEAATSGAFSNLSPEDLNQRAADGLLINGSVNNGAASPFAQIAAFGNNRRGSRPLYTGGIGVIVDNSALNARSYSLTGQDTPKPSYNRLLGSVTLGGPLRIPHLIRNGPTFFFGYQRTQNRSATTQTSRMPTVLERSGDLSAANTLGQPVQIFDPLTGASFPGNVIPQNRITPQARALLTLYPLPNFGGTAGYNYQIPIVDVTHQDSVQSRFNKVVNQKNQFAGNFDYQSTRSDNPSLFNFLDATESQGINAAFGWTYRPLPRFSATFRYQFSRLSTRTTPYFANRLNVSGQAGISGNNQEPVNWGPPSLTFSGGIASLSDSQYAFNRNQTSSFSYSSFWNRGRHNITFGADYRRVQFNVLSQQDARGGFAFTGEAAGSDFADFLLGIPDTGSIAFGNADKYFRQSVSDAFVTDDWRMSGSLTVNAGVRWEYEAPITELYGRLVNLDVAPGFAAVTPVVAGNARNSLLRPDRGGIQPRISFAWRPVAASSLIVRGGYGVYRNTSVYQSIAIQMAQQSPLSKSLSVQNTSANPLTLANGFYTAPGATPNTFAIDPDFRVGYAQTWQLSIQRDLPAALQVTAMYMGTKGTRLMQELLPHTFPRGALNPCPGCPTGYLFLSSNGNSNRHSGQIQLRRRLRSGLTANAQYTFSKAIDNAPLMAGPQMLALGQGGPAVVQNWLDLKGERALSNFDQRHQLIVQSQYTTGAGVRGGALLSGWRGALFKEWTFAAQMMLGSGLPQTPTYPTAVRGTGVTGSIRPDTTGASVYAAPSGLHLNPAAYRAPAPGQWGNAGRNSIAGPSQFDLNASLGRTFPWGDRYNIDLRVDARNVLNHVTFQSWNTTITNAQFGLPYRPNPMRSLQTTLRLRF